MTWTAAEMYASSNPMRSPETDKVRKYRHSLWEIYSGVCSDDSRRKVQRCGPGSPTEDLRAKLAEFYAERTLTKQLVLPRDCANAIVWLTSDQSAKTTGHVIPVDGGLPEAFLR